MTDGREIIDQPYYSVLQYDLEQLQPDEWTDINDVPDDIKQIVGLQKMAQADGDYIDEVKFEPATYDEVMDTIDNWGTDQKVFVERDEQRKIIGILSYYVKANGVPFFEVVAVDPHYQQYGTGARLIDTALQDAALETDAPVALAQAQERVVAIYERKWGAEVVARNGDNGQVTIEVPLPRLKDEVA